MAAVVQYITVYWPSTNTWQDLTLSPELYAALAQGGVPVRYQDGSYYDVSYANGQMLLDGCPIDRLFSDGCADMDVLPRSVPMTFTARLSMSSGYPPPTTLTIDTSNPTTWPPGLSLAASTDLDLFIEEWSNYFTAGGWNVEILSANYPVDTLPPGAIPGTIPGGTVPPAGTIQESGNASLLLGAASLFFLLK